MRTLQVHEVTLRPWDHHAPPKNYFKWRVLKFDAVIFIWLVAITPKKYRFLKLLFQKKEKLNVLKIKLKYSKLNVPKWDPGERFEREFPERSRDEAFPLLWQSCLLPPKLRGNIHALTKLSYSSWGPCDLP